jgi:hypothetical protein
MTTSALNSIITAIETHLTTLGFSMTDDVFDFDAAPDSIINKAARITVRRVGNEYYSGDLANPKDEVTIWIAYQAGGAMSKRTVEKAAIDDRQAIEIALLNSVTLKALQPADPFLTFDGDEASTKELGDYIVSKIPVHVDYQFSIA